MSASASLDVNTLDSFRLFFLALSVARSVVRAAGSQKNPAKAHSWKANYHDMRAIVKFIEAFGK